jgi:phage-related protein
MKVALGDGAEQRIRMGLNSDPKVWDLQFNHRTNAERDQIRDFLEAHAGVTSFDWTTLWGQTGRRWVCEEWNIDPTHANNNQIRAKFKQVFEY